MFVECVNDVVWRWGFCPGVGLGLGEVFALSPSRARGLSGDGTRVK